ncbi:acyl-CoA dehydrogenase family protein [Dactylosporangium aurantiacum]|uniref:Acyl-CoA dehydrogenase family protein n=1 Tax=Dactylosporangium aurantiacum TaxID=35754 RepID=A0A9Q9IMA3_9ACTN|nr:acyl-CoA dehydrogenase family protein [Dactylosporangium aurantiacum]MDG6103031.1 acyl-CoA dehydrogenase family protein [Dactylosporangium aurantiacum]UWZ57543.1 acyl-CoA dehydrogenase family protein [Dactylosporangium aurantiacum]
MDFDVPQETADFAAEVDAVLRSPETARLLQDVRARRDGMDGDVRPLYRHLGAAGILAPSWPVEYGGRGLDYTATVTLLEQLVARGIPQNLYCISVQNVGSLILASGDEEQRRTLLPAMASAQTTACILFTEPTNGSDLAALTTTAVRDGDGWVINGRKTYNLKSAYADFALIAVRTDPQASQYEGITLFLVPLDAPGVVIRPIPSMANEQFHDIWFTDVRVDDSAVFGRAGAGWSLITQMFAAERTGLDYYARGRHWLNMIADRLGEHGDRVGLARYRTRLAASKLLSCQVMQNLQEGNADIAESSFAKWHCSETAQRVAWWSLDALGPDALVPGPDTGDRILEAALREAPGVTISGGASEVMLDILSSARVSAAGGAPGPRLDPLQARLRDAVDAVLTHTGDLSAQLATIGVPALNAPERLGGLALGLTADIVVNERLGYALQPLSAYRETAFALDLLADADLPAETVAALYEGTHHAVLVGARAAAGVAGVPGGGGAGVRVKADGTVWGEGGTVWGESEPLPRGNPGLCLVHAAADDGRNGWHLVLPDPGTTLVEAFEHFGTPATRIRFDGATAAPLPVTAAHWERALAAARIRQAALLLGMADRILEVARTHVNTRVQSGRPLVERQTVAHRLAVLMGEADGWRLVLHKAAWDHDRDEPTTAAALLAAVAEHAQAASRTALQLHGVRGMLAHSTTVTAYRQVAVESLRLGSPAALWQVAAVTAR